MFFSFKSCCLVRGESTSGNPSSANIVCDAAGNVFGLRKENLCKEIPEKPRCTIRKLWALLSPITNPTRPASVSGNYKFHSPLNFQNLTGLIDNPLRTARQRSSSQKCHRNCNKESETWAAICSQACVCVLLTPWVFTDRQKDR